MTITCLLLFVGAMGKSAQVPLHVWLPDSMEGPTPISALIHAATMVTAGIFMVARMSPLFELSETALSVVMIVGAITAFFMALIGLVQNDIKRVVAYSTLSQLGYMTVALGASAYAAGIFHLGTHAFFKALLFLCAGSVIIAMHHEQDMRKMGGLRKYMPITYITALIGSLALAGIPPFAGFFSKDAIIEAVHASHLPGAGIAYIAVLLGVFITAFYSFRLLFMTFHGECRADEHTREHLHESPWVVTVPLILLAIPSILAGMIYFEPMLFGDYFRDAIHVLTRYAARSWRGLSRQTRSCINRRRRAARISYFAVLVRRRRYRTGMVFLHCSPGYAGDRRQQTKARSHHSREQVRLRSVQRKSICVRCPKHRFVSIPGV